MYTTHASLHFQLDLEIWLHLSYTVLQKLLIDALHINYVTKQFYAKSYFHL